jgi:tRNA threonylcarbamoyladenosine biosynthesis protein TsaE
MCVFLRGELGAGKSSLVRGFLRARGVSGAIKSPTYGLVEPYRVSAQGTHSHENAEPLEILHMDLYRLKSEDELEYLGVLERWNTLAIWLIEWPERALHCLPSPDLEVQLEYLGDQRRATIDLRSKRALELNNGLRIGV